MCRSVVITLISITLLAQEPPPSEVSGAFDGPAGICHACFWQGFYGSLRTELVEFYRHYQATDPLIKGDLRYVLWRATGKPDCSALDLYREVSRDADANRRYVANAILGLGLDECGRTSEARTALWAASAAAGKMGLRVEAGVLASLAQGAFTPRYGNVEIHAQLKVPPGVRYLVLGSSKLQIRPGARLGTQIDRVSRDWLSYQMKWTFTGAPLPVAAVLNYHEGALVRTIAAEAQVQILPLAGALAVRRGQQWYAPDETGTFRFEILEDKIEYPTTHASMGVAWVEDTHGASSLVAQAIERHIDTVVACGDSEGKVQAAYYLAQKGINVILPGDRYQDLLLGYEGDGVIMGTAPVHGRGKYAVIGDQPVRFALREPVVVEDTKQLYPLQYYDAPARYFRRLAAVAPLNLLFAEVSAADQLNRVLDKARQNGSAAVAVRVATEGEYRELQAWLRESGNHRAVLFHSGLYPYAQPLFREFPATVTFGDLHPRFE